MPKADSNTTARPSKLKRKADKREFASAEELYAYIVTEKGLHPALAENCVRKWQLAQEKAKTIASAVPLPEDGSAAADSELAEAAPPKLPRKRAARAKKAVPEKSALPGGREGMPMDIAVGKLAPRNIDNKTIDNDDWM